MITNYAYFWGVYFNFYSLEGVILIYPERLYLACILQQQSLLAQVIFHHYSLK